MYLTTDIATPATTAATTATEAITQETNDVIKNFKDLIPDNILNIVIMFGIRVIISIIIWFICSKLINAIMKIMDHSFEKAKMEISVAQFLKAFLRIALKAVLLLFIIIGVMRIESMSITAVIGSAGLAIGLALQGSLSNFAGGLLILLVKPFKVGDYIIEKAFNNEGTVTAIDIFYTKLLTIDNKMVVIPNGALSNASIVNVTNEEVRRLDINVKVDYSESIDKVKGILYDIASSNELVLKEYDILVFVSNFDPSAINIGLRAWVMQDNYLTLKWELLEKIKKAFDENNITIPYDQLDVNVTNKN